MNVIKWVNECNFLYYFLDFVFLVGVVLTKVFLVNIKSRNALLYMAPKGIFLLPTKMVSLVKLSTKSIFTAKERWH